LREVEWLLSIGGIELHRRGARKPSLLSQSDFDAVAGVGLTASTPWTDGERLAGAHAVDFTPNNCPVRGSTAALVASFVIGGANRDRRSGAEPSSAPNR
jgi:hypothetical protein